MPAHATRPRRTRAVLLLAGLVAGISVLAAEPASAAPVPLATGAVSVEPETTPTCLPGAPTVSAATATTVTITIDQGACDATSAWRVSTYAATSAGAAKTQDTDPGATSAVVISLSSGQIYRFKVASVNSQGAGPDSAVSAFSAPPFTSLANLVDRQYLDFRLRSATSTEQAGLIEDIRSGNVTSTDLLDQMVDSPEWAKQSPMIRLFQAYFLRLPDIGGLNYWTNRSRNGTRINTISASFASSSEFTRRYGKLSNKAFVELVYRNVLGRPGDAAGIRSWTGKLDAKTKTRGEVMVGFSESNEYKNKTRALTDVVNIYTGMLRRTPTTTENQTWEPLLKSGTSRRTLILSIFGSAAYDARVS